MVEIITIGNEIISGKTLDTNSTWMANLLYENGFPVKHITSIADDAKEITDAIDKALSRADIVITTGGLGPTKDDITKHTLCEYFKTELIHNSEVLANIERLYKNRPSVLNDLTKQQALVPKDCIIIQNKIGTAPIMWFEKEKKVVISLPGVPREMRVAMAEDIIPRIEKNFRKKNLISRSLQVYNIAESALAIQLDEFEKSLPNYIKLAYLPHLGIILLRLSGYSEHNNKQLEEEIEQYFNTLINSVDCDILSTDEKSIEQIIGNKLREKSLTIGTAESCTGGNISHRLTLIPGSSDYFQGGIVTYSNKQKVNLLGVLEETLEKFGAVSQQVVEQMAIGARNKLNTDISVAVSGVAGPGGGTEEKPVGCVWIAVSGKASVISKKHNFGDFPRDVIIERASTVALLMVNDYIEKEKILQKKTKLI